MIGTGPQFSVDKAPGDGLFGRERELASLRRPLEQLFAGHGGLVLITGEAGIGKTSLVQSIAREAVAQGASVLTAGCYDLMATPPYGPWLELFSNLRSGDEVLPLPTDPDQHEVYRAASQDALFSDAFTILQRAASERPTIVVLEDLHWTDSASLEFLRYVSRQLGDLPLLLIVTYRDTDLDREHPLRHIVPILVREAQATRVSVRPLDESAVRQLVADRYSLSPADEIKIVDHLQNRGEGNPFFISETLRTLEDEGILANSESGWTLGELDRSPMPPLVRQVVEERLNRLDETSRDLLVTAAIIGQDIPLDIWQAVADANEDDLSSAVKNAIDLHLMEETGGASPLRFTHALVRQALYYELGLPRRRILHRRVGEALAAQQPTNPDTVAYHFQEAQHEAAAEWLMAAGERAQRLYAWRTAAERFDAVVPFISHNPDARDARGWLLYRIGLLLIYADPHRGIIRLREAEQVGREIGDHYLIAYARADRGLLRCIVGDVRQGLIEMQSGVAALDEFPPVGADSLGSQEKVAESLLSVERIRRGAFDLIGNSDELNIRKGALVFWLAWSGRFAQALEIGEPYIEQIPGDADGLQDSLGDALAGLGHTYAALGRPDEAFDAFSRARNAFQRIEHHFKVGNTAIYELSEAFLPYRADRIMERQWLADQAEAG